MKINFKAILESLLFISMLILTLVDWLVIFVQLNKAKVPTEFSFLILLLFTIWFIFRYDTFGIKEK